MAVCGCWRQDGYFVDIAKALSPTLGYMMLVSACIAMLNEFNASIATTARIVQVPCPVSVSASGVELVTPARAVLVHDSRRGPLLVAALLVVCCHPVVAMVEGQMC